jgi:hypothetical protein
VVFKDDGTAYAFAGSAKLREKEGTIWIFMPFMSLDSMDYDRPSMLASIPASKKLRMTFYLPRFGNSTTLGQNMKQDGYQSVSLSRVGVYPSASAGWKQAALQSHGDISQLIVADLPALKVQTRYLHAKPGVLVWGMAWIGG